METAPPTPEMLVARALEAAHNNQPDALRDAYSRMPVGNLPWDTTLANGVRHLLSQSLPEGMSKRLLHEMQHNWEWFTGNVDAVVLGIALKRGHHQVIDALADLLSEEARSRLHEPRNGPENLFMHTAAHHGHPALMQSVFAFGFGVNTCDYRRRTPLHEAAERGHTEAIAWLVERGATVNAPNDLGQTPLQLVTLGGHVGAIAHLVRAGADVNAHDKESLTPLHLALRLNNPAMVNTLLRYNADPNQKIGSALSPAEWAAAHGKENLFRTLARNGAAADTLALAVRHGARPSRETIGHYTTLMERRENTAGNATPAQGAGLGL